MTLAGALRADAPMVSLLSRGIEAGALCHKVRQRAYQRTQTHRDVQERRARFYDAIWRDAAQALGWSITDLTWDLMEMRLGSRLLRVRKNSTSLDDQVTAIVAGDKFAVHKLLSERGIPVPSHVLCAVGDWKGAWSFVRATAGPCVVKPARGTARGEGITSGVRTRGRLVAAMMIAGSCCSDILIERQVAGNAYRLLFFDGDFLDAVLRRPPVVKGDGTSTVRELIDAENRHRIDGGIRVSQSLVRIDAEMRNTLADQRYGLRSVPASGSLVRLKNVVADNRREDNVAVAASMCSDVIHTAAAAAQAVGVRLAGVDIMTPDPGVPLSAAGGAIIEVNTDPGHYYHYLREGEIVPLATIILERLAAADM